MPTRTPKSSSSPSSSADLRRLIEGARAGDIEAYNQLLLRFSDKVYGLAFGLLGDEHTAQDVVQETFAAAHRQLPRLKSHLAFGQWLRRIVLRRCRRIARRQSLPMGSSADENISVAASSELASDLRLEAGENHLLALEGIRRLPAGDRQAISLHYLAGYPVRDISRLLRVSETAIKSRLHHGRLLLRQHLSARNAPGRPADKPPVDVTHARFRTALRRCDVQTIQSMIKKDRSLLKISTPQGMSLVGHAMREIIPWVGFNHRKVAIVAEQLIGLGAAIDVYDTAALGRTHEMAAHLDQHPHLLRGEHAGYLFCKATGDPSARSLAWLLDRGLDPNQPDYLGDQALHMACHLGNLRAVRLLLNRGADPTARDAAGLTPLHRAVYERRLAVAVYLIRKWGQPYDSYAAAGLGDTRAIHGMVGAGSGDERPAPEGLVTPLDVAAKNRQGDVARLLIERGAGMKFISASQLGLGGAMPELLRKNPGLLDCPQDPQGWAPLHYLAYSGNIPFLRMLLDLGADANKVTLGEPWTPLDIARLNGNLEVAEILTPYTQSRPIQKSAAD